MNTLRALRAARPVILAAFLSSIGAVSATGQNFTEDFSSVLPMPAGWAQISMSDPAGINPIWFQGNTIVFNAHSGGAATYAAANFQGVSGANTISNWLFTPVRTLKNGDTLRFHARTATGSTYPDRLQVRLSLNGISQNVGTTNTSVGDFTTLLLDINPTYTVGGFPDAWTQYSVTLTGIAVPTPGRFAFRYFVENGGPDGTNSDYIGIDTVSYTEVVSAAEVSISGRVLADGGMGLTNAIVSLTDQSGSTRIARTSAFGYYRFDNIESGQNVVLSVASKRYQYLPRTVAITDELDGLDFEPITPSIVTDRTIK